MAAGKSKFQVAIIIAVRNDDRHIGRLLDQLYMQDFPMDKIEVVVADGQSTDGTRRIAEGYKQRFGSLKILDNPARLKAAGNNLGVKNSTAPYIMVLDARIYFTGKDIIKSMVETFESEQADCLCRPPPLAPPDSSEFQQATAYCRSSILGHRPGQEIKEEYEGPIDPTSSGAMYKRQTFETVGFFDESFDGCEDVEFNYRIKLAGLRSYLSQKLRQFNYPPNSIRELWRQMYRYGRGRFRFARKHNEYSVMQWLAGFGVALFLLLMVLSFLSTAMFGYFKELLSLYLILIILFSLYLSIRRESLACLLFGIVIFPVIHFGLGLGFIREFLSYASKN